MNTAESWNTTGVVPVLNLGQRLRVALEHAGMDVEEMGEVLGRGETTIRNYMSMRTPISRGNLLAWAFRTGVDPVWLETGRAWGARDSNPEPTVLAFDEAVGV